MSDNLPGPYVQFQEAYESVWRAYARLGEAASEAGTLDPKTRRLVKLGMAAAMGNESAVHSHTHRALELGISPKELEHAVILGVTTMGFPRMMKALTWVQAAVAAHEG